MNRTWICRIVILMFLITSIMPVFDIHFVADEPVKAADINPRGNWSYFVDITIDHTMISEDLTDFPVLVRLNDTLADKCDGGNVRFYSSDMKFEFPYEIEKWVDGEERLVWVRVTNVYENVDTVFRMYYSNATAPAYAGSSGDVWTEGYEAVWHMNDTSGSVADSTSNGIDLTPVNTNASSYHVTGKVGYCMEFNGTNQYLYEAGTFLDVFPNELTIEAWWNRDTDVTEDWVAGKYQRQGGIYKGRIWLFGHREDQNSKAWWNPYDDTGTGYPCHVDNAVKDTWWYMSGDYKKNGDTHLHLNTSVYTNGTYGTPGSGSDFPFTIGAHYEPGGLMFPFDGRIDEARVSNVQRSGCWLNTSFHSMNNTTGFMTFGGQRGSLSMVSTNDATDIDMYSATLHGYVLKNNSKKSWCGFVYGLSSGVYTEGNITNSENVANDTLFSNATIKPLHHSTTYYYQAWLNNSDGYIYGGEKTFTTLLGVDNWNYFVDITIDHNLICENLTDFPILVRLNDSIADKCEYHNVRFFNVNMSEEFPYEIEKWVDNEERLVWVRVSNIYNLTDTVFRMYYNSSQSSFYTCDPSDVWNDGYEAVWHMNSSGDVYDSTGNHLGTNHGTDANTNGRIDGDRDFIDGDNDYVDTDIWLSPDTITIESWINMDDVVGDESIMVWRNVGSHYKGWMVENNYLRYKWLNNDVGGKVDEIFKSTNSVLNAGSYQYVAITQNGDTTPVMYVNDSSIAVTHVSGNSVLPTSAGTATIGRWGSFDGVYFDGYMDEVRISNVVRSKCWINASYHSQNNSTGFMTFGLWDQVPTLIVTNETTDIFRTTATLNGYLIANASKQTWTGFRYGTSSGVYPNNVTVNTDTANGTVISKPVSSLSSGTWYYVQAWANNSDGFTASSEKLFITDSAWWNESYAYRMKITIDESFIDCDLVNFPILVVVNSTIGAKCDGGNSTRFLSANNSDEYYYEIELWNSSDDSFVWVNVTYLYDEHDTVFYMYYNNSLVTDNQSISNVWDDNYLAVYHMNSTFDSAGSYDLTNNGAVLNSTGKIGKCYSFDTCNMTEATLLDTWPEGVTWETWFNINESAGTKFLLRKVNHQWDDRMYFSNYPNQLWSWGEGTNGGLKYAKDTSGVSTKTWYYGAMTYENNTQIGVHFNTVHTHGDILGNIRDGAAEDFRVGSAVGEYYMKGEMDEIRISDVKRSDCWLKASYHTMNSSTGFMTFREENIYLTVATDEPTLVEELTTTLHGALIGLGIDLTGTVRFQLNDTTPPVYTKEDNTTNQTVGKGPFLQAVTGLTPGHLYHYRAYVNNTVNETWGVNKTFLTKPNNTSAFVVAPTGVSNQLGLTWINHEGGDGVYIEFSDNVDPGAGWNPGDETPVPSGAGYITGTSYLHNGLTRGHTYYYKQWATATDSGWTSSNNTTAPYGDNPRTDNAKVLGLLAVVTNSSTGVEEMNATLHGYLQDYAEENCTCRFQLNDTTPPIYTSQDNITNHTNVDNRTEFSDNIPGLTPGNLYHYRSYANNSVNETFGANVSFLTKPNMSTDLGIQVYGSGFNISWNNHTGANTTVLVYKTTGYPTSPTDGAVIYNGTKEYYHHLGLYEMTDYYYRVWSSANYTYDGDLYHQFSDGTTQNMSKFMLTPVYCFNATSVTKNTAILHTYFYPDIPGINHEVGFWIGRNPTGPGSWDFNLTTGAHAFETADITKVAPGLVIGDYYYCRSWSKNATSFSNSTNEIYFLTRPEIPTGVSATSGGSNMVILNWVPGDYAVTNRTTYIRWSDANPPNDWTDGTLLYNGTGTQASLSGLESDKTYYFSLWTQINDTGSPLIWAVSSDYASTSSATEGGLYNVSLRWENGSHELIDFRIGWWHQFIVHYANKTEYNFWDNDGNLITVGDYASQSDIVDNNCINGNFTINCSSRPIMMEFKWNDADTYINVSGNTTDMIYSCDRIIVPQLAQRNITFYMLTDKRVYGESTSYPNNSLIKYNYGFIDQTGSFSVENNALAEIFLYDQYGNKLVIHSEYFSSEFHIYPMLLFNKKYFIGVYSDELTISNLGICPTEEDTSPRIVIPYIYGDDSTIWDICRIDWGWNKPVSLWVSFYDVSYSTSNITLDVYYSHNNTLFYSTYAAGTSIKNFTVVCNTSLPYLVRIGVENTAWTGFKYVSWNVYHGSGELINKSTIDEFFELLFGDTPVENTETGATVGWAHILLFGGCFILLTTFGRLNAFLGMMSVGIFMVVATLGVDDLAMIGVVNLTIVGVFILALGILGLIGGVESR